MLDSFSSFLRAVVRSPHTRLVYVVLSVLFLAAATLYSGWYGNLSFANDSDAIVYPYLFKDLQLHDLLVPGGHALLLKWPLFGLQSVLPYNFLTFSAVSIGLYAVTIAGWCWVLVKIFGRKYLSLICVSIAAILFASIAFPNNMVETTVRNIEYPIGLWFLLTINRTLMDKKWHKREKILASVSIILFALVVASDSLTLFAFSAPAIGAMIVYWLVSGRWSRQLWQGFWTVLGATIGGLALLKLTSVVGIVYLYYAPQFAPNLVTLDHLGASIMTAIGQLMTLYGAGIFGQRIALYNTLFFVNFLLLVAGVVGLFFRVRAVLVAYRKDKDPIYQDQNFIFLALGISCLMTFLAYALSTLAVHALPNGTIVDSGQTRYLTLLPIEISIGLIVMIQRFELRRHLHYLAVVTSLVIVSSLGLTWATIHSQHHDVAVRRAQREATINNIATTLESHNVQAMISGYWLGATTRFYSHDRLSYISVATCTDIQPKFNTRLSWAKPTNASRTALVVDRQGSDKEFWDRCSDQDIAAIFGDPAQIITLPSSATQSTIEVLIYNYDVREKLPPIAL